MHNLSLQIALAGKRSDKQYVVCCRVWFKSKETEKQQEGGWNFMQSSVFLNPCRMQLDCLRNLHMLDNL